MRIATLILSSIPVETYALWVFVSRFRKYGGDWVVIRSQVSKCAEMFWKFLYSLLFYSSVAKPHISVHVSKERTCDYAKVQSPVPRTRGKLKTLKSKTARPVSLNCTR